MEIIRLPLDTGQEKVDPNSYFKTHTADDFRELPRRDFFDCILDTVPLDGSTKQRYKALLPLLELVVGQPELTWNDYVSVIDKRFPGYGKRKLDKQIAEYSKAKSEENESGQDSCHWPMWRLSATKPL